MTQAAPFGGSLARWLDWQLALHSSEIDLGLERVRCVARRLNLLPFASRVVTVAGTNGKGSCVRLLESLLRPVHRVGSFTSPHLWRYNERVRIDGTEVAHADLCSAFEAVERARADVSLTFFEYGTLAALWLFQRAAVDYALLEVGLGGRLDAVNIVDADVALITNIGLDHIDWLGDNREAIGAEKAGILRAQRPAVCADRAMPQAIARHAASLEAPLYRLGHDYDIDRHEACVRWSGPDTVVEWPLDDCVDVLDDNLAAVLAVMVLLGQLPDKMTIARACREQGVLPGRRELVDGDVPIIYDVGHNAEAVAVLVAFLQTRPISGATHVVIGMLSDKPVETVAANLRNVADHFYAADLTDLSLRGLSSSALAARLGGSAVEAGTPSCALATARAAASAGDRIVVCGSFFTVAHARAEQS